MLVETYFFWFFNISFLVHFCYFFSMFENFLAWGFLTKKFLMRAPWRKKEMEYFSIVLLDKCSWKLTSFVVLIFIYCNISVTFFICLKIALHKVLRPKNSSFSLFHAYSSLHFKICKLPYNSSVRHSCSSLDFILLHPWLIHRLYFVCDLMNEIFCVWIDYIIFCTGFCIVV